MKFAEPSCLSAAVMSLLVSSVVAAQAVEVKPAHLPVGPAALAAAAKTNSADAAVAAALDIPYATIVARNMFGLVPIPPPVPTDVPPPADPPPKITANGIMTIFGHKQALFKVADKPKAGQPQKDSSHVLSEGEREDDIEVVKIDTENNVITFNNHGEVQELAVTVATASGGAPGAGGAGGAGPGGGPGAGLVKPNNPFFRGRAVPPPGMNAGNAGINNDLGNPRPSMASGGGSTFQTGTQQPQQNIEDQVMSAAQQIAQIEQNRLATQEAVTQGTLPPLPPTQMTPSEATGTGGAPLITSPLGTPFPFTKK